MAAYDEYKDSGTSWLGQIPAEWETGVIGSLYKLRNTKVSDVDYPPLSVTMKGIVPQLENAAKTDAHDARKLVLKGDFAINSRSDRRGSCGISEYDGSVSLINTVLTPRKSMNPKYYNWLFHTVQFADEYYKQGHGIVNDLWTTRWDEMKRIIIPVPSDDEQKTIAEYLDEKINHIDSIISEAKDSIEEYKVWKLSIIYETVTKGLNPNVEMKDSGIEWIGEIPSNWKTLRIKDIGDARNGLTYSPENQVDEEQGTLVLRSSNVKDGRLIFSDNVYVNIEIPAELMLKNGDILICSRNGSKKLIGKNAYINESDKYTYGAFMMSLRPKINNSRYIYWILNSGVFGYYLPLFFTSTINQLTRENFRSMVIPYCDDTIIQNNIVKYLDNKVAEIDSVIEEKEQLVADLEKYKKSLIFEVIAGKRKVV